MGFLQYIDDITCYEIDFHMLKLISIFKSQKFNLINQTFKWLVYAKKVFLANQS